MVINSSQTIILWQAQEILLDGATMFKDYIL